MKYQDIQNKIAKLLAHDKCLHFIVGFFLAVLSLHFLSNMLSIILIFTIALMKEIRDEKVYKGFDIIDLIFTVLPVLILILMR